jgi:hypothetical protein
LGCKFIELSPTIGAVLRAKVTARLATPTQRSR